MRNHELKVSGSSNSRRNRSWSISSTQQRYNLNEDLRKINFEYLIVILNVILSQTEESRPEVLYDDFEIMLLSKARHNDALWPGLSLIGCNELSDNLADIMNESR